MRIFTILGVLVAFGAGCSGSGVTQEEWNAGRVDVPYVPPEVPEVSEEEIEENAMNEDPTPWLSGTYVTDLPDGSGSVRSSWKKSSTDWGRNLTASGGAALVDGVVFVTVHTASSITASVKTGVQLTLTVEEGNATIYVGSGDGYRAHEVTADAPLETYAELMRRGGTTYGFMVQADAVKNLTYTIE